jgi:hypothetical protein
VQDVEGWLEEVDPSVLAFWEAFDRIEPIGDAWQQTALLAYCIEQLTNVQIVKAGGKARAFSAEDFMPSRYDRPATKRKVVVENANQLKTKLTSIFNIAGAKHGR